MPKQPGSPRGLPERDSPDAPFAPYVPATESPLEFSAKAIAAGVVFGICFGAANAYLGLQAGLTISTSIPVAVMTVAAFRLLRRVGRPATILEANLSQTVGSASSSVASVETRAGISYSLVRMPFSSGYRPVNSALIEGNVNGAGA